MVWVEEKEPTIVDEKEVVTESAETNFVDDRENPKTSNPNLNTSTFGQ